MLYNLAANAAYEISLAAGSSLENRFGDEAATTFVTLSEDGRCWKLFNENLSSRFISYKKNHILVYNNTKMFFLLIYL